MTHGLLLSWYVSSLAPDTCAQRLTDQGRAGDRERGTYHWSAVTSSACSMSTERYGSSCGVTASTHLSDKTPPKGPVKTPTQSGPTNIVALWEGPGSASPASPAYVSADAEFQPQPSLFWAFGIHGTRYFALKAEGTEAPSPGLAAAVSANPQTPLALTSSWSGDVPSW